MESLEKLRFASAVFSLKSSDIDSTIRANVLFSRKYDYPLHIGMTEAGPAIPGIVSNTIGIASLLKKGYWRHRQGFLVGDAKRGSADGGRDPSGGKDSRTGRSAHLMPTLRKGFLGCSCIS